MGFIRRSYNPLLTIAVCAGAVLWAACFVLPSVYAAENGSDPAASSQPNRGVPNRPSAQPVTDPNEPADTPAAKPSDPNTPEDSEENDDFYPRLSTYLAIQEAYDNIFTPELITDDGRVDYGTLRRKRQDVVFAAKELKELNPAILMAMSRNEKIAFWINTYNFCTLKLIIDHYPIEPKIYMIFYPDNSIMQISGSWRTKEFFDIQGFQYTLEEIEWNFLLDRYKDPRIIFALSYASYGGAILRNEPYTAERLDAQLDDQVRQFLQSSNGMRIEREEDVNYLSNIFTMHNHEDLFLESKYASIKRFRTKPPAERAWLNFIWHFVSGETQAYLEEASPDIRFMKYDWLLNEAY